MSAPLQGLESKPAAGGPEPRAGVPDEIHPVGPPVPFDDDFPETWAGVEGLPGASGTRWAPGERTGLQERPGEETGIEPAAVRSPGPVRARDEILYRKAQGYHRLRKDLDLAADMYQRVLRENPGHCGALFSLSSIHMEQSRYAEAYPLLAELVSRSPEDPQGLTNLAVAEIALGRPEKAVAHLDRALLLPDPPRFKICLHQGVARSKLGRLEEAIAWYRNSEELDPGDKDLLFNMAVTYDRLGRYDEALKYYARFLQAGESASAEERRDVQARIGVLTAYLVEDAAAPLRQGTNGPTEPKR
jgi:Flp pilus assembly protein TadD